MSAKSVINSFGSKNNLKPSALAEFSFRPYVHTEDCSLLKAIFRQIVPGQKIIDGIGFEAEVGCDQKTTLAQTLKNKNQIGCGWDSRLKLAAAIAKAELAQISADLNNEAKIEYLQSVANKGDIIFVTGGGKRQGCLAEMSDMAMRAANSRKPSDLSFPFTHVMVNIGDGTLIDLTPHGIRRQTWKQAFISSEYYDCVAVSSLRCTEEERGKFVQEVLDFSAKHKKYNFSWILLTAPFEVRRREANFKDTSVSDSKAVCTDYITEPAKALASKDSRLRFLCKAINPIQIFESQALKISAVLNLKR